MGRNIAVDQQCYPSANFISVERLDFLQVLSTWKSNLMDFYE